MRAPDKADFRATAVESAAVLLTHLPSAMQHDFCVFVSRLSHTPKVRLRLLHSKFQASPLLMAFFCPEEARTEQQDTFRRPRLTR